MHKLVLDKELRVKLNNLDADVEVYDEDGRRVGHFLPEDLYMELMYAWAKTQFTDEELEAARQEPGGYTTPEALDHIEKVIRSARGQA